MKLLFKKLLSLLKRISPRYQLSYDDDYFDVKEKVRKFRFKSFGDHSFPEFTFKEIRYDENILFSINPLHLIKITEKNYAEESARELLKIEHFLRNNEYKMGNMHGSNTFSGDEICDNPLLAEQVIKNDLFKIAYMTGFERGRKISKIMSNEIKQEGITNNVVDLKMRSKEHTE